MQNKKLKSESRLETLKLLASLAPSSSSSSHLLSSSSLGQNPLNPVSAREREERREDKLVRRGIDRLEKRNGPRGDESGDGSDSDAANRRSKGKGKAVDVVHEVGAEDQALLEANGQGKASGKKRRRATKKVCRLS